MAQESASKKSSLNESLFVDSESEIFDTWTFVKMDNDLPSEGDDKITSIENIKTPRLRKQ